MNDQTHMRRALELAAQGIGFVSPNPMVGAVVVNNGRVVGEGYHQAVGGPHAEVHALKAAGSSARGATLYVTLEPCNHHGRTPPCTASILASGVRRVVSAMTDPNRDVAGGGHAFLKSHGVDVSCGVCEDEARRLNESYIKYANTKLPFVVLKLAATLDGCIATSSGDSRWVTCEAARTRVHQWRHAMDAIMVGIGTIEKDDPRLTARLENDKGKDPIRIILDSRLRIQLSARVLDRSSKAEVIIVCDQDADRNKKQQMTNSGVRLLEMSLRESQIDLGGLMGRLGGIGITSLLIEGGARVAGSALQSGIVDKVALFYAPKLLVSDQGVPMCRGRGPNMMKDALVLRQMAVSKVGEDILVEGYL